MLREIICERHAEIYTGVVYDDASDYSTSVSKIPAEVDHNANMFNHAALERLRREAKVTQTELAEKIGVEQPTVQRWEKGKRSPDADSIIKIARVFEVPVSDLLDHSEIAKLGLIPAGMAPEDTRNVVSFLGSADVHERRQVSRFVRVMQEERSSGRQVG
jgi:transcriptional regulator with XRE-family HTH domain